MKWCEEADGAGGGGVNWIRWWWGKNSNSRCFKRYRRDSSWLCIFFHVFRIMTNCTYNSPSAWYKLAKCSPFTSRFITSNFPSIQNSYDFLAGLQLEMWTYTSHSFNKTKGKKERKKGNNKKETCKQINTPLTDTAYTECTASQPRSMPGVS